MSPLEIIRIPFICVEVLLLFNLLIFVHEMGHFLAARWRGLYVEEFALWFGKPLWRKKIGGVWYALNSLPFGGYVKLPQMAPMDAIEGVSEDLPPEAKAPVTPLDKIIVAFAGPLFSFLLAVFFAVLVWQIGKPVSEAEKTTVIGAVAPGGPAELAGLRSGDEITAIDGHEIKRWHGMADDTVIWRVITSENEKLHIDYLRDGKSAAVDVKPEIPATKFYQRKGTRQIQAAPKETPLVEKVKPGEAAAEAGLQKGDLIIKVNDQPVYGFNTICDVARANPDAPLMLTVKRNDREVKLERPLRLAPPKIEKVFENGPGQLAGLQKGDTVASVDSTPVFSAYHVIDQVSKHNEQPVVFGIKREGKDLTVTLKPEVPVGETKPKVGLQFTDDTLGLTLNASGQRSVIFPKPFEQIRDSALSIYNTIAVIANSKTSVGVQQLGGPAMMLGMYYRLFQSEDGWRHALWLSVLLNVNLAMLNLLPLPVLDGGHITFGLIEIIRRRPIQGDIENRILQWVQTATAMVLIGFMLFVTVFDVQDLFGGGREPTMKFPPKPALNK